MNKRIKPLVFAYPVLDLTLSRYLAAMEVEFLGIDLDSPDRQKTKLLIHQFREWVSGPKLIGVSAMPSKEMTLQFPLDGYYIDADLDLDNHVILFRSKSFVDSNPQCKTDYTIIPKHTDAGPYPNSILNTDLDSDFQLHESIIGYMITPGNEEKTGIYNFEKLDEWFERLGKSFL
jgi:hypothetical protein